jgi:hypothetical protein
MAKLNPQRRPIEAVVDELQDKLISAQALSELLFEFAAPGGDLAQGQSSLESLGTEALHANLSTLNNMLIDAKELANEALRP